MEEKGEGRRVEKKFGTTSRRCLLAAALRSARSAICARRHWPEIFGIHFHPAISLQHDAAPSPCLPQRSHCGLGVWTRYVEALTNNRRPVSHLRRANSGSFGRVSPRSGLSVPGFPYSWPPGWLCQASLHHLILQPHKARSWQIKTSAFHARLRWAGRMTPPSQRQHWPSALCSILLRSMAREVDIKLGVSHVTRRP